MDSDPARCGGVEDRRLGLADAGFVGDAPAVDQRVEASAVDLAVLVVRSVFS
ncbi:hypothetical protein [Micromonospora sp. NPDC001898]|uniref:hypothetical protein n=1 Tax=Micromonospora sp. NPDC001898 TaxID=3364221 RepID=UPI0036BB7B2A